MAAEPSVSAVPPTTATQAVRLVVENKGTGAAPIAQLAQIAADGLPYEHPAWTGLKDIVGGTMGGMGLVFVGHPFDTMKVS
jgi:hypothetical protein